MNFEEPRYKLSQDGTSAIDMYVTYYSMDSCPLGVKVQLHTIGGVSTHGIVSETTASNFKGWRPLPKGINNGS